MEVRYLPDEHRFANMNTEELRETFLVKLFDSNKVMLIYSQLDRAIVGSAVPVKKQLELKATKKEMAAKYFAERREVGVINIGGKGSITVDGKTYTMDYKDALYIGRGAKKIVFKSSSQKKPAKFYIASYPAHKEYPTTHAKFKDATPVKLGSLETSNARTIYKYIYPGGIKSCQLVMGLTELETGSVWNTMPAHTHQRRSEIYMYFNLSDDNFVTHLMGKPEETRHLIIRDGEAVISPSWSIHAGAGTKNYSFIWGMGGENQDFDDMDWVPMKNLK
jgi:4-deoxy-L-threo-5-hexosulose-uronate ketol-isomerase